MAARNAGQRRKVLAELNEIRNLVKGLRDTWDVRGTVYVDPAQRATPADWHRPRRPEEYPEEQAVAWAHLYNVTDDLIRKLTALREQARTRYFEVEDAQADKSRGDA